MNIQSALVPTGKAVKGGNNGCANWQAGYKWHAERLGRRLVWCDEKGTEQLGDIDYLSIISNDWQPYHEVKEIRPEDEREVWINKKYSSVHVLITGWTELGGGKLVFRNADGHVAPIEPEAIHGKNGWERIHPLPEGENVERIEFDNIRWDLSDCWQKKPMPYVEGDASNIKDWGVIRDAIKNKPPMKMTLEWSKS